MKPAEVSTKLRQIASAIESSKSPRPDLVAQDVALLADIVAGKKKKKTLKSQKRGDCVFPHTSNKVKDNKDHFPINSEAQARNALSRANQYDKAPPWYDGSLQELVSAVARKVHGKYPDIEVSEASKKPGKGKGKKKKSSMEPSQVSYVLNQIATAIDNSENPRADLVIEDLKRVVAALAPGQYVMVSIIGDSSAIFVGDTDLVPPDGKYMNIDIPNSDDVLFVVDPALLKDPQFIADHIPSHLVDELAEQGI